MGVDNGTLIRRWFEEVWNKGRSDVIDEMLAEDCIIHGLSDQGQPVRGPAEFKSFHQVFRTAFPNIIVVVEDTISEGDKVAVRCTVRGKHEGDSLGFAATNADTEFTGIGFCRLQDGKFVEVWNNFDFMTMYKQLGTL